MFSHSVRCRVIPHSCADYSVFERKKGEPIAGKSLLWALYFETYELPQEFENISWTEALPKSKMLHKAMRGANQ